MRFLEMNPNWRPCGLDYMTDNASRRYQRNRSQRRRDEAKDLGLCQWCGEATIREKVYCPHHMKLVNQRQALAKKRRQP